MQVLAELFATSIRGTNLREQGSDQWMLYDSDIRWHGKGS